MKLSVFNMRRPAQSESGQGEPPNPSGFKGGAETGLPAPDDRVFSTNHYPRTASLRQRLLNRLLAAATGLTWLLYLLALPGWIEAMSMGAAAGRSTADPILPMAVYGGIAIGLSVLTLAQRVSAADRAYPWRAAGFLILLIGAGGFMLASQGLSGNGRLLLVLFPLLAVFLFSEGRFARLVRFAALTISIFTLITIGFFAVQGYLLTQDSGAEAWLIAELGFGLIAIVSTLAFDAYLHDLESGIEKSQVFAFNLERERQRLEAQVRKAKIDMEYRLQQILSANEINQYIRSGEEPENGQTPPGAGVMDQVHPAALLFGRVCEQIIDRFGYAAVKIFLVESNGQRALLTAEAGETNSDNEGGDDALVSWVIAHQQTRINRPANDPAEGSAGKASPFAELALPIPGSLNEQSLHPNASPGERTALGVILFRSGSDTAFSKDEIALLESIAGSLASAIENQHLTVQIESNLEEISALHRQYLRRAWMQVLDTRGPQEYQYVSILHPGATPGRERHTGPILMGSGITGGSDSRPRAESMLEIPIQLRDQVIGSLVLEPEASRPIGEQERILIEAVINQAALALENARLLDETRQRADQEMITAGISTQIWSSTDIETILQTALHELGTSLNAAQGSIELWPESQDGAGKGAHPDDNGGSEARR